MKRTLNYPVILGLGLEARDKHLLEYWLGEEPVQKNDASDDFLPGQLAQGLHYFPSCDLETIEKLSQWPLPFLVAARKKKEEHTKLFSFLWELGIAALWLLPEHGETACFPFFSLPLPKGTVFLIEENPVYRNILRQIFYFAGYHVQIGFLSAKDISLALEQGSVPDILYLNLDHSRVHHAELASVLHAFFSRSEKSPSHFANPMQVFFTKDFSIPGFSFTDLEGLLSYCTRRIFEPQEALFALLKAFFSEESSNQSRSQSLRRVLSSPSVDLECLPAADKANRGRFPFLWLYSFLGQVSKQGILLLKEKKEKKQTAAQA